jgi:hypothetical protein
MNHPVDQPVTLLLDRPPIAPTEEQERVQVRMALDLGADGVLDFPALLARGREPLVATVMSGLTGDLYDASWTLVATVLSDFEPNASSTTWRDGVRDLRADVALRRGANGWQAEIASQATTRAIAATAAGTLWAVGDGGLIMQRAAGGYWALNASKTKADLHAVAASPDGGAIAVGAGGVATHWGGSAFALAETGVSETLTGVWMASASDAWAVGGAQVLHFDGGAWTVAFDLPSSLRAVWGAGPEDLWVVGDGGFVARYDGQAFTALASPTARDLYAVWGGPGGEVWAAGDGGTLLRLDGEQPSGVASPTTRALHALWGPDSEGAMLAVGARGTILRRVAGTWRDESPAEHLSTLLAVGGTAGAGAAGGEVWAMGSHEVVLGPMMAIPEALTPSFGAPLGDRLTWTARPFVEPHFNMATFGSASGPCTVCGMQFMIPFTEWTGINRGHLDGVRFPDLSALSGKPPFGPGAKDVEIVRVYLDDAFDFDATDGESFYGSRWRSWAVNATTVTR